METIWISRCRSGVLFTICGRRGRKGKEWEQKNEKKSEKSNKRQMNEGKTVKAERGRGKKNENESER